MTTWKAKVGDRPEKVGGHSATHREINKGSLEKLECLRARNAKNGSGSPAGGQYGKAVDKGKAKEGTAAKKYEAIYAWPILAYVSRTHKNLSSCGYVFGIRLPRIPAYVWRPGDIRGVAIGRGSEWVETGLGHGGGEARSAKWKLKELNRMPCGR